MKWYEKLIVHAFLLALTVFMGALVYTMNAAGGGKIAYCTFLFYFLIITVFMIEENKLKEEGEKVG